jgi:zinc protease
MTEHALIDLPNSRNVTRIEMPNGITVLVYENPNVQSVVVNGSLRAGVIYEQPDQNGVAALVSGSLMHGTKHRDFDTINSQLEDIGADLSYSTGTFKAGFSGKALAEDLPTLIEVLADTLRHPTFPAEHVERLRGERLTYLNYRQQDTRWLAAKAFRQNLYPAHHPFHYPAQGSLESIPGITLNAVHDFHTAHFGPDGMILVVVGAVQTLDALNIIGEQLGDWQNPGQPAQPELPPLDPPAALHTVQTQVPGKSQSDIVIGTIGPSRYEPDYRAAVLANSILGQFGMMGRIGEVVREREGLAYYAYSSLDGGFGPGSWRVSAGVSPEHVERTITLARAEIQRITSELVSEDDLADNQSYFTGRLPLQLENNEGVASMLHTIESYDLELDYLMHYTDEIYKLTRDDLRAAASRYLDPDHLVVSVAGPNSNNR